MAEGSITSEEYMFKLENFIKSRTEGVLGASKSVDVKAVF
mgnify:CR=1 FL=1